MEIQGSRLGDEPKAGQVREVLAALLGLLKGQTGFFDVSNEWPFLAERIWTCSTDKGSKCQGQGTLNREGLRSPLGNEPKAGPVREVLEALLGLLKGQTDFL